LLRNQPLTDQALELLTTQAQRSPNVSGADSDPLIA
jgi:hypothetical protein